MGKMLLPLLVLGLSGCSMFQSNVKGGFSCGAARGTCAPSTTIDDAALHAIDVGKTDLDASASSPEAATPRIDSADAETARGRGALKVVYPAWRDRIGHVHKRAVAYLNVDAPGLNGANSVQPVPDNPAGTNLLALAESAPDLALVSPSPSTAPPQDPAMVSQPAQPFGPTAAVSSSPATTGSTTPLGAIQAQVRAILAHTPKPTIKPRAPATGSGVPSTPPQPALPATPTPGGTFPPQSE